MAEAIRINKEVDAPKSKRAAEFAKNIDESAKIKTDESTPEYKDGILPSKEEKAVTATGIKLEKSFEINENVQRVSSMNAKGMADAVQSAGHTLVQGDLVELKVVKGKAIEIRLFDGIPSETENRVMKYEGVRHDGKNPSFIKATDADLAAVERFYGGAGRRSRGSI